MTPDKLARAYNKVLKFSATDPDLQHMLKKFAFDPDTRSGGGRGDETFRLVLADKLQELGREREAHLLREGHPVKVTDNPDNKSFAFHPGTVEPAYDSHTSYGGIPLAYHCERPPRDHGTGARTLCADCLNRMANERAESKANEEEPDVQNPQLYQPFLHEEGSPIECDDCNNQIEAAYGDPDNPEDGY